MLETILLDYIDDVSKDCVGRYKLSFTDLHDELYNELEKAIKAILSATLKSDREKVQKECKNLAELNFENDIPYVVLVNEINSLKSLLTSILLDHNAKEEVFELHSIYSNVENVIAYEHLGNYMKRLFHFNNVRISSLKDLMKKNLVKFYQSHLEWLNDLTIAIKNVDVNHIPQLDSHRCTFGHWLDTQGREVISNNSKYRYIQSIHATLHSLAKAIKNQMKRKQIDFNILVNYLEKCEFISLSIGTELALIDNRLLIKESSKDKMTGALNRNALDNIFFNQYELALATNTSFVLAVCDLDHFKKINDTYGHTTGDLVLKEFVSICKNQLRDSDIIIRYGGEEFVIMLPNSNIENGIKKLNDIRMDFHNLCCSNGQELIDVSVSMGAIAIKPTIPIHKSDIELEDYIEKADALLYKVKASGRNRVAY